MPIRFPALALGLCALAACQQASQANEPSATRAAPSPATSVSSDAELIAQGEYLVKIGGCNDCHTPGYSEAAGDVPKERWLLGSPLGYHGPWGTTYAANLRLKAAEMDDAAWLEYTGALHTRPIMPDFTLRAMKAQDRLAIFRFLQSLGTAGQPAPAYLPPGEKPPAPYMELVLPPGPPPAPPAAG